VNVLHWLAENLSFSIEAFEIAWRLRFSSNRAYALIDFDLNQRWPEVAIRHSDQSSQYTSVDFGKRCKEFAMRPSMGSRGDA
jgi:transposase InsO family protein